jgi:hypothetical protein
MSAADRERVFESVLPSLAYGPSCSSTIGLHNLSDKAVTVGIEAHRGSGALVPLVGHPGMTIRLEAAQRVSYKLSIEEETTSAWVKVRENIPWSQPSSRVAIDGLTECVIGNELRTVAREITYPTRNPWFSGDLLQIQGELLAVINTSERAVIADLCYSSGSLFSAPDETRQSTELTPICSSAFEVQIPPFGTRQFPVERAGNSHFSLKTRGRAIALQMLRPVEPMVNIYAVDSTVKFGNVEPSK